MKLKVIFETDIAQPKGGSTKMAENLDLFCCSICLGLLKDPVTTACGHSYCTSCIYKYWEQDGQEVYSCPECRQTFKTRPLLKKNTVLAEVVDNLSKTAFQDSSPSQCYAEPGDVECDFCTGTRKQKALMSCLVCLASYCETHLKPHYEVRPLKKHTLVEALTDLQEKVCPSHNKLLDVYCRTDKKCICLQCTIADHKGHDTVSTAEERTIKQQHLGETQKEWRLRAQHKEKEVEELRQAVNALKDSSWETVDNFERIFTKHIFAYIRLMEMRRCEVKELIRAQEMAGVSRAEGLLKQLEKEVAGLKKGDAHIEQLSHTEDDISFLQSLDCLCDLPGPVAFPSSFEVIKTFLSEKQNKMENIYKDETIKILESLEKNMLTKLPLPSMPEYRMQQKCLMYSYNQMMEVDPYTACASLSLSNKNKEIGWSEKTPAHVDHPDRFSYYNQALCKVGLSEISYWEVEWSGGIVDVAVSYKGIGRKGWGNDCCFGHNEQSWSLVCAPSSCSFWHNNNCKTNIPVPNSSRVGVYLDHREGTLSFYSVSDTMTLLHRVQTTFTQPLYPGFGIDLGSSLKICPNVMVR
ncbi:hypothetical protein UPYG_G00260670 [Umbra pygmaea]|uniref:Tripartite motif-containing protein 16-like n=1 Tax=Umbra pygmaea TaxID=75934 RepID=A0ABD0WT60_UMBPY